jgi:hypothetical protein
MHLLNGLCGKGARTFWRREFLSLAKAEGPTLSHRSLGMLFTKFCLRASRPSNSFSKKYGCKGEPRFAFEAMGVAMNPSWVNG